MKKLIKWIAIVVGVLVGLLIIGAVALPFIIPMDKVKDIAVEKISEAINRDVKIESVSFNIFSGIELKGLTISNRPGYAKKPFVSADAIALRYAFWPLFKRQVIIKEIRLVKPEILIEKSASGVFNFSDMTQKKAAKPKPPTPSPKKSQDISLIVDTFSIRDAKITYKDYGTNTSTELKDGNLTISGFTLAMLKPISLNFSATANYKGQDIPLSLAGKVAVDLTKGVYEVPGLTLGIAGEKANISAKVSNLIGGPWIDFSITSKKLEIDPLLAVFTAGATAPKPKEKAPRGQLTKTVNKAMAGIPSTLRVQAKVDMGKVTFLNFKVDKALLGLAMLNKQFAADIREIKVYGGTVSGTADINLRTPGLGYKISLNVKKFNAAPFSNAVVETFLTKMSNYQDMIDKVYGNLDLSIKLSGSGVEVPDIMASANASGSLMLTDGELKRLKILESIADKIKSPALKDDLKVSELSADFTFKDQIADIKNLKLVSKELKVGFHGGIDIGKLSFVPGNRLNLKASPAATKGIGKEYDLFRDKDGWFELDFQLTGSLKKPIPLPVLEKPVEKVIEKVKIKIEAKTIEVKKQAEQKIDEEKQRLADEAKKQAEEEAKKQLKNLIKF